VIREREEDAQRPPEGRPTAWETLRSSPLLRSVLRLALSGPALILLTVLVVLHDFAFGGMITTQHADILTQRLPDHCFLGRSLAAGDLPTWNPHVMGGTPFAADPQSGWLLVPAMLLYSVLPCDVAVRWYFVLQPILAGLGIYWFLRNEGISRIPSTMGGLVLAVGLSGSFLAASLPFSGTLAWTSVALAAISRYLRTESWTSRPLWAAVAALAWGQIAATHLSNGLVVGTGAIVGYVAARVSADLVRDRWNVRTAAGVVGLLLVALPLVNLAVLLPRLGYIPKTSLSLGYMRLLELNALLPGYLPTPFEPGRASLTAWPLKFATSPGTYLGALPLALSFAGFWSRRYRYLAIAFGIYGFLYYLVGLDTVARALAPPVHSWPFADFYLHRPWRFSIGLILAMAIMGSLGAQAWGETTSVRRRTLMVAPGILVWGFLPLTHGVDRSTLVLLAVGVAGALVVLGAATRWRAALLLLPVLLATELSANALFGARFHERPRFYDSYFGLGKLTFGTAPLEEPRIRAAEYLEPGRIGVALQEEGIGRYLTQSGYAELRNSRRWESMGAQRATLFGLEDAQGYNALQLRWFWTYVRSANPRPVGYNFAVIVDPSPTTLNLLQIRWLVTKGDHPPDRSWERRFQWGRWVVYEREDMPTRASVVSSWFLASSPGEALGMVLAPEFDPAARVILLKDPGAGASTRGAEDGTADYEPLGPGSARVEVETSVPAFVLIRNVYDRHWSASINGRSVQVLRANYFLQAVAVPSGMHTILLEYDDPWIGLGLLGSGASLAILILAGLLARRRTTRTSRSKHSSAPSPEEPDRSNRLGRGDGEGI
jgi:hypothetical protein